MKAAVLAALLRARARKQSVALVTEIATGAQAILGAGPAQDAGTPGELALGPALRRFAADALAEDRPRSLDLDGRRYFVQVYTPPRRLIVVGAVHIAQSLVPMAALAGYEVIVVDPRRAFATAERFPGTALDPRWPDEALAALAPDRRTAVVTLTHDPKLDDPALAAALATDAFYIGALGSGQTHAKRLERLREGGLDDAALARIHAPVGLDIGAVSPAEIAISILAEMTGLLRRRPAARRPAGRPGQPADPEPAG